MAEASAVVALLSFGMQVCQGLVDYYSKFKDRDLDIRRAHDSLKDLCQTLKLLYGTLTRPELDVNSKERAEDCMNTCLGSLSQLQRELKRLQPDNNPKGIRETTLAGFQRVRYPFEAGTLAKLHRTADGLKQNLSLALQVLQIDTAAILQQTVDLLATDTRATAVRTEIIEVATASMQNTVEDVAADTKAILHAQQSALSKEISKWLSPSDPHANHESARQKHEDKTGAWLLKSAQYERWKSGAMSHLWLYGKAGSGKTILCSTVIEDIRDHCSTRTGSAYAMFYFTFSDNRKQSYNDFIRSLVVQLGCVEPGLSMITEDYEQRSLPGSDRLEEILRASLLSYEEIFILLDALDECPAVEDGREEVLQLLERISRTARNVKILVTSRDVEDIRESTQSLGAQPISMATHSVDADIQKYTATRLEEDRRLRRMDAATKSLVKTTISQKANGMFRWAHCQIQELKSLPSMRPEYVRKTLESLPRTLDETYERILAGIKPMFREEAVTLLRWLAYAQTPLTLAQLAEAAIIDLEGEIEVDVENRGDLEGILNLLSGLITQESCKAMTVTVDDLRQKGTGKPMHPLEVQKLYKRTASSSFIWPPNELDTVGSDTRDDLREDLSDAQRLYSQRFVRLAHFSVQEYLESNRIVETKVVQFHLQPALGHRFLAQGCLAYLIHYHDTKDKTSTARDMQIFPLLLYAIRSWYKHFRLQEAADPGHSADRAVAFLSSQAISLNRLDACELQVFPPPALLEIEDSGMRYGPLKPLPGLYCACVLGLETVVAAFIKSGADVDSRGGVYGFALHVASKQGPEKIVQMLIDAGADVNVKNPGSFEAAAIQVACVELREKVVEILIAAGADVRVGPVLQEPARAGNVELVRMLLKAGADPNTQGKFSNLDTLHSTIAHGGKNLEKVVQELSKGGADVNSSDDSSETVLRAAARRGLDTIVSILIDAGAKITQRRDAIEPALWEACYWDHEKVVQQLLNAGAAPSAAEHGSGRDAKGCALCCAAQQGSEGVVRLLIESHVDVEHHDNNADSVLCRACGCRRYVGEASVEMVVRMLIDVGADVNARGQQSGRTPLQIASERGFDQVVTMLKDAGAVE